MAFHCRQDAIRAALHRQVQLVGQHWHLGVGGDQPVVECLRVGSHETQTAKAIDLGEITDEQRQVGDLSRVHSPLVGIDVLAEQRHLARALFRQAGHLGEHVVKGPGEFLATRVRHDAIGAVLRAALHDGDEGAHAIDTRFWQTVEFLDLRKGNVHGGTAAGAPSFQQFGQPLQGLRAEHHIHERRAPDNGLPFL